MTRHYCTYFDHRYLPRGLALRESLVRHDPGHVLWILCLSTECEAYLRDAALPGTMIVPLAELERQDPGLADARRTRSLVEYYFTCSPAFCRYVLSRRPDGGTVTYLDSDLYFFSSPAPVFEEIGDASVAIVPHRFAAAVAAKLEVYGKYNVGWLTFRRDDAGEACLDWWRERCIEWCFDRVEPGRFADQKYLDRFHDIIPGKVHDVRHPGANLGPWNVATHVVAAASPPTVDERPLVFYHFQGFKQARARWFDANLREYGARLRGPLKSHVYAPYLRALLEARAAVRSNLGRAAAGDDFLRYSGRRGGFGAIERALRLTRAALAGDLLRIAGE